jgi:hypothetical protein
VEPADPALPPDPVAPPAPDPAPPLPLDPAPPPDPVEPAVPVEPVVEPALPELVVLLVEVVPAAPLDVELVELPDVELPPRPAVPPEVVLSSPPHAAIEVARTATADATRKVTRVIRPSGVMGTRCKQFPAPRRAAQDRSRKMS